MANGPDIYDSYANASNNITLGAFLAAFKSRLDNLVSTLQNIVFDWASYVFYFTNKYWYWRLIIQSPQSLLVLEYRLKDFDQIFWQALGKRLPLVYVAYRSHNSSKNKTQR